ncbi:MAG: 30S ribosomal protein S1 [Chloroflexi bacterium]|nr:30S ribosomal protein S1 [Chloroflexota bacterium]
MKELLEAEHLGWRDLRRGDVVEGQVVRVDRDGIWVDVGSKSEGLIPVGDVEQPDVEAVPNPQPGDQVVVFVRQPEDADGRIILSLERARSEKGWMHLQEIAEAGETFEAKVVDHNKGGLIVDAFGVRGFVPASQVAGLRPEPGAEARPPGRLAQVVGQTLRLKVIEMNRRKNRLILSERVAVQEWRARQRERLLEELAPGQVRAGRVTSLSTFGAFVDLGGADGLVHLSELSWDRVRHPQDLLQIGQEVQVFVLHVDRDTKKISLSLRRMQPEPWMAASEKYHVGEYVKATVTKLTTFGAFAQVEPGVEGLIHISELDRRRVNHPKEVVHEGDVVMLKIVKIEPERRRLGLSLRQAQEELGTDSES